MIEPRQQIAVGEPLQAVAQRAHRRGLLLRGLRALGGGALARRVRGGARFARPRLGVDALDGVGLEDLYDFRHAADLVAALAALDFDGEIAAGERAHLLGQSLQRPLDLARRHPERERGRQQRAERADDAQRDDSVVRLRVQGLRDARVLDGNLSS